MSNSRQYEYLKYACERIDAVKNSIYVRASVVMAGSALLATRVPELARNAFAGRSTPLEWWFYGHFGLFLLSIGTSIMYAMSALQPLDSVIGIHRLLRRAPAETMDSSIETFTAFPHITVLSRTTFVERALALTDDQIADQMVNALYTLAHITEARYAALRKAVGFFIAAVLMAFGLFVLIFNA